MGRINKIATYNTSVTWQDSSDETLLAEISRVGDSRASFTLLVQRHSQKFHRLAYRLLGDVAEAEDVVQHCFVKLWERPEMYNPERNTRFTTWFYRVVMHRAADVRKARKFVPMPENYDAASDAPGADEMMERTADRQALQQAFATLPLRQQQALVLCYDQELSNREAAEVMGLTLKALQGIISRGKEQLRQKLQQTTGIKRRKQSDAA